MVTEATPSTDSSRPQLWRRYWKGAQRSNPLDRLVWLVRSAYSAPTAMLLAREISSLAAPSIFEIGCGSATTTRDLAESLKTGTLAGLDIVPQSLGFAIDRLPHLVAHVGDARRVPVVNGRFDLVFSVGLIEHFSRMEAMQFLKEHIRVTKPGGVVAVTVPNGDSPMDIVRKMMGRHWPFGVEHPFSPHELHRFFEDSGLQQCKVHVIRSYRLLATGRVGTGP